MSDYDMRQDLVRTRERLTLAEQEVARLRELDTARMKENARLREEGRGGWGPYQEELLQRANKAEAELTRLENELEVEVDAHARLVSTNAKLQKALETGRCPRCGEWFRDDPKTRNVLKETT